ncbi:MAG: hypothetical protein H7Y32_09775 [Chloroflexales bacterium]|nr:hypothetical protein [Chloroflexales bacterium]
MLTEVPTGKWVAVVVAEDGLNPPVVAFTNLVVDVLDKRAPAEPTGLTATSQAGELLIKWTQNGERDLAGYEIGFGVVQPGAPDSPDAFVYSRDMGAKQVVITASGVLDARLWGLEDDQEVFVGIRAYDQSGNKGDWSPLLRAKPWALAPDAWTPAPGGLLAMTGQVEVAFASPLQLDGTQAIPAGLLELRRDDGSLVPGRLEALSNLDGDAVVGLRFVPDAALRGGSRYTAVVKGGAGGIAATDGRQMAHDYSWSFVAEQQQVYLPLVGR